MKNKPKKSHAYRQAGKSFCYHWKVKVIGTDGPDNKSPDGLFLSCPSCKSYLVVKILFVKKKK